MKKVVRISILSGGDSSITPILVSKTTVTHTSQNVSYFLLPCSRQHQFFAPAFSVNKIFA